MLRFSPLLALAACTTIATTSGAPAPEAARISSEGVEVRLSNGRVCRGGGQPEDARSWSGALDGCPDGWRYAVVLDARQTNPARYIVEAVLTALTIEETLAPFGEVMVTDAAGRVTIFVSPPAG